MGLHSVVFMVALLEQQPWPPRAHALFLRVTVPSKLWHRQGARAAQERKMPLKKVQRRCLKRLKPWMGPYCFQCTPDQLHGCLTRRHPAGNTARPHSISTGRNKHGELAGRLWVGR